MTDAAKLIEDLKILKIESYSYFSRIDPTVIDRAIVHIEAMEDAKVLPLLRRSYTALAFAFNRMHGSARHRDGELCLDFQKVRAEIETFFKDAGAKL